jgi:polysaccharide biosynthesis/export protein
MLNAVSTLGAATVFAKQPLLFARTAGLVSLLLAAVLLCSMGPAMAEYRLEAGDVLQISVARLPELNQRVPVQIDGTISFPLLGRISVAGLSPTDVQAKVQALLAVKAFRQRTADGRDVSVTIEADEVTATIAEYRPIYVNGDVSKPGELAYRPRLTVRQAVALAGGYDALRFRLGNPVVEAADLQGEYESLWAEYAKEQARVWRLKQELGQQPALDQKALLEVPLPRSTAQAIVDVETESLKTSQADAQAEKTFLQRGTAQADAEIQVLSEQQKTEDEGAKADADDLARMQDLFNRGTVPILRVSDARRAMLLSSTRKLQTTAQLMATKRQRDELSRQMEQLDGKRRTDQLRELLDATVALSKARSKLQSTGQKIYYAVAAKSELANGSGPKPTITIVRNSTKGTEKLNSGEDSELQPGDVVEIALRPTAGADLNNQ